MPLLPERYYQFHVNPVLQGYREQEGHHDHWHGYLLSLATHALDRAKERYNVSMTGQDWERLNWAIFREKEYVKRLFVLNETATIYEVQYIPFLGGRKRVLNIMFSETAYAIGTVIPASDLRVMAAERGEMKDIQHSFSPLLKRRYELLLQYQNKSFGHNHGKRGWGEGHEAPPRLTREDVRSRLLQARA